MNKNPKTAETAEQGSAAASRMAMVAAPFRVRKYRGIITQAKAPPWQTFSCGYLKGKNRNVPFFFCGLLIVANAYARGLDINADVLKVRRAVQGEDVNIGKSMAQRIVIKNTGSQARGYSISFHKPSELGVKYNSRRYEEIPDAGWLWTEVVKREVEPCEIRLWRTDRGEGSPANVAAGLLSRHEKPHSNAPATRTKGGKYEIEIGAGEEKEIEVFLRVPEKQEFYGRRFCAVMAVSEIPLAGLASQVVLAVYPRIEIETIKK